MNSSQDPTNNPEEEGNKLQKLLKQCDIEGQYASYSLYYKEKYVDENGKFQKYIFGEAHKELPTKVIMLLGATGAGKTTLVQAMVNYIQGVNWEDPFRLNIADEATVRSQTSSQTHQITVYELSHQENFKVPYPLTIIDTPGFEQTETDEVITDQILALFSSPQGVTHIDAICIVLQDSSVRSTAAKKAMFDSILGIFGKETEGNINFFITFSSGKMTSDTIIDLMKSASTQCHKKNSPVFYKFNNYSPQTVSVGDDDDSYFQKRFWREGKKNLEAFFQSLKSSKPQNLTSSVQVLREHKKLQGLLKEIKCQTQAGLSKLGELKKTQKVLEQYQHDKEINKIPAKKEKIKTDIKEKNAFTCLRCDFTCHHPCTYFIANINMTNYSCKAIDLFGNCKRCPSQCGLGYHSLESYKWEEVEIQDSEDSKIPKMKNEISNVEREIDSIKVKIRECIEELKKSLHVLQASALKPNVISALQYIDRMNLSKVKENSPQFKFLQEIREHAKRIGGTGSKNI